MLKTILFCGSLKQPLEAQAAQEIISALKDALLHTRFDIKFINQGGEILKDYIDTAITEFAQEKNLNAGEICEKYTSTNLLFMMGVSIDIAIFIGGDNYTEQQYAMYIDHTIPVLGIPFYGGIGEKIYNQSLEAMNTDSKAIIGLPRTRELFSGFKTVFSQLSQQNIGSLRELLEYCLVTTQAA